MNPISVSDAKDSKLSGISLKRGAIISNFPTEMKYKRLIVVVYESVILIGADQLLGNSGRLKLSQYWGARRVVIAVFKNLFRSVLPASDWIESATSCGSLWSRSFAVPSSVIPLVTGDSVRPIISSGATRLGDLTGREKVSPRIEPNECRVAPKYSAVRIAPVAMKVQWFLANESF